MDNFTLLDLVSQCDAVRDLRRGKSKAEIIDWLRARGEISPQSLRTGDAFRFTSTIGREAIIWFDGDDLVFVGDHPTFK